MTWTDADLTGVVSVTAADKGSRCLGSWRNAAAFALNTEHWVQRYAGDHLSFVPNSAQ
jgi:hypothetical protein